MRQCEVPAFNLYQI